MAAERYPRLVYRKVIKRLNRRMEKQDLTDVRRKNILAIVEHDFANNKADFARAIDRAPAQVNNFLSGKLGKVIGAELARHIEGKVGLEPGYLDRQHVRPGKPSAQKNVGKVVSGNSLSNVNIHQPSNVEEVSAAGSRLPLISWVSAGLKDDANDPYAPGNAEAWLDFDSLASSVAFCLRVRGDSMVRPDGTGFPNGCIIAVEPRRRPKSGEFVVVRFNNTDEATFKQLIVDGPLKMLKPLNPAYPVIVLGPDAQLVGTVFEKRVIEKF
jgi:SOS-response transcriptional repressor LexA